ncbi:MAG: hypothetical protein U0974_15140 [Gemmatimonadales bacterium]|nr:hypothetical protein [Gemmatimonadales bacterium]MDZ4391055.1 hypothetical protein [Gemmatimonadales bacterium]
MASPAIPEPRAAPWVRATLALAVALPLILAALLLVGDGWLSDTHGAFLHRVRFAVDRGRLELLGFEYPPLPFLLLTIWPSVVMPLVLGALGLVGLGWLITGECTDRRSMLPLVLLVCATWTPIGIHLVASDFNETVGLLVLFLAWRYYRRWWSTRQTVYGLYTGILLGVAFYTSPLGLALALFAGALLPLLFPRLQIPPFSSQLVLLAFPGMAATATWAYLSWVFVGRVAFPFTPWEPQSPTVLTILSWTVPYLVVSALAMLRREAQTAGVLLPLLLLAFADRIGWHFSLAYAVLLVTLVAIVALPRDLHRVTRMVVGIVAVGQALVAWWLVPWPTLVPRDLAARAVAEALAGAPPRSILIDDRYAETLLKWSSSMRPYLTTRDTGFEVALAQPGSQVRYVVATADDEGLTLDADRRPPPGFLLEWSWAGYTLWRRPDASPRPVRFDALPDPSVLESSP